MFTQEQKDRVAQHAVNLQHRVKTRDIYKLETIFAKLTDEVWVIPEWLLLMRVTAKE